MKTKNIKLTVSFKANPHKVYEALMDSKKHSKFSGSPANISRKVSGKFTAYGDYIEGENIELVADKKIVQSWRASDWPEGEYSEVIYSIKPAKNGTELVFTQTGIPEESFDEIKKGWDDFYWKPMKKMLEK